MEEIVKFLFLCATFSFQYRVILFAFLSLTILNTSIPSCPFKSNSNHSIMIKISYTFSSSHPHLLPSLPEAFLSRHHKRTSLTHIQPTPTQRNPGYQITTNEEQQHNPLHLRSQRAHPSNPYLPCVSPAHLIMVSGDCHVHVPNIE